MKKYSPFFFNILACILLLSSFQYNLLGAASSWFFTNFQLDSESLVIGRLHQSDQHGGYSYHGFLGRVGNQEESDAIKYQYESFTKGTNNEENTYHPYIASFGFQGAFYHSLNQLLFKLHITDSKDRLHILKVITSAILVIVLLPFLNLIRNQFGTVISIGVTIMIAYSQWLIVFANNLYWMFFLALLPFNLVIFILSKRRPNYFLLYFAIYLSIFIKSLAGYEYISTIMIATLTPFVFFHYLNNWHLVETLKKIIFTGIACLLGFFSAMALHVAQLKNYYGSWSSAFEVILYNLAKRTHGNPATVDDIYRNSLESSIFVVLLKYMKSKIFDLQSIFGIPSGVPFFMILLVLGGCVYINKVKLSLSNKVFQPNLYTALNRTLWFSLLAPLSWHILAKGHSYIHTHMNHILWYVPFLLWGYLYITYTASTFIQSRKLMKNQND